MGNSATGFSPVPALINMTATGDTFGARRRLLADGDFLSITTSAGDGFDISASSLDGIEFLFDSADGVTGYIYLTGSADATPSAAGRIAQRVAAEKVTASGGTETVLAKEASPVVRETAAPVPTAGTTKPAAQPTARPTAKPITTPTARPTAAASAAQEALVRTAPTAQAAAARSAPTARPTKAPTAAPTAVQAAQRVAAVPTASPTDAPTPAVQHFNRAARAPTPDSSTGSDAASQRTANGDVPPPVPPPASPPPRPPPSPPPSPPPHPPPHPPRHPPQHPPPRHPPPGKAAATTRRLLEGTYTYNLTAYAGGSPEMDSVELTLMDSTGTIVWQLSGESTPCKSAAILKTLMTPADQHRIANGPLDTCTATHCLAHSVLSTLT